VPEEFSSVASHFSLCFCSGFDDMPTEAWTTKEELLGYFKQMYTGRRMEILCDTNYKVLNFEGTIF